MGWIKDIAYVAWDFIKSTAVRIKNAISSVVSNFFGKFRNWIIKTGEKVKQAVKGALLGVRLYIKKISENIVQRLTHHFSKNGEVYEETIVTKKIDASEVPPEFLERASYSEETDLTNDFENVLEQVS